MRPFFLSFWLLAAVLLTACGPGADPRLQPSGHAVAALSGQQSFPDHVDEVRHQLRVALQRGPFAQDTAPFGPGYDLEQVVDMRAPWQMGPHPSCADPRESVPGFLFIHGLTDSPYTLRPLARALLRSHPCAMLRGVLLPGHGTVPGDLLAVHRQEWRDTVEHAIDQFRGVADTLYLVGYSTGAALALEQADSHRGADWLAGLILFSPAIDLGNPLDWLTPLLRHVRPWLSVADDRDAAKYESFPANAAAEAYLLLRELAPRDMPPLQLPVFMVSTGDDTTVDAEAARRFFCDKTSPEGRHMIWYHSRDESSLPEAQCEGMELQPATSPDMRVVSYSHVSTSLPPEDPHYGLDGLYRQCLRYLGQSDLYRLCNVSDADTVYGEPARLLDEAGLYQGSLVRRATFNPYHLDMMQTLNCFLQEDCQP